MISEHAAHWHGATASTKMVQMANNYYKADKQVTWLHAVKDEDYASANKTTK